MNAHLVRTYIRITTIALLLLVIIVAGFWYFTDDIDQSVMHYILSDITELQEATGYSIAYETIYVDLFHHVHINNMRLIDDKYGMTVMTMDTVDCTYSLYDLIFHAKEQRDIYIKISTGTIHIDEESSVSALHAIDYIINAYPPNEDFFLHVELQNLDISYKGNDSSHIMTHLSDFSFRFGNYGIEASIKRFAGTFLYDSTTSMLTSDTTTKISYNLSSEQGSLTIPLITAQYGDCELGEAALSGSIDTRGFNATLTNEDMDAVLSYTNETHVIETSVNLNSFPIKKYKDFIPLNDSIKSYIGDAATLEGTASLSFDTTHERIVTYNGTVDFNHVDLGSRFPEVNPSLKFSGDSNHFIIEELDAHIGKLKTRIHAEIPYKDIHHPTGSIVVYTQDAERQIIAIDLDKKGDSHTLHMKSDMLTQTEITAKTSIQRSLLKLQGDFSYKDTLYPFVSTLSFEDMHLEVVIGEDALVFSADYKDDIIFFDVSVDDLELCKDQKRTGAARIDAALSGNYTNADVWNIKLDSATIQNIAYGNSSATIELSALADPERIKLHNIIIDDHTSRQLFGDGEITYTISDLMHHPINLDIVLSNKTEQYDITALYEEDRLDACISLLNGNLDHSPYFIGDGIVSGKIDFLGTLEDYSLSTNFVIENGKMFDTEFSGDLAARISPDSVAFSSKKGSFGNVTFHDVLFDYSAETGKLISSGNIAFSLDKRQIAMHAGMTSHIPGIHIDKDFSLNTIKDKSFVIDLNISDYFIDDKPKDDFSSIISYHDNSIGIKSKGNNDFAVDYSFENGSFTAFFDSDIPLSFTIKGTYKQGKIDAVTEDLSFDLSLYNTLNLPFATFKDGTAHGSIYITGKLTDLEYYGELFADSIDVDIPYTPKELYVDELYVSLIGKELIVAPFSIRNDETRFDAELTLFIDDIIPTSLDLSVSIPEDKPVSFAYGFESFKMQYNGKVAGDIHLNGYFDELTLNGDIFMDRGIVSMFESNKEIAENINLSLIDIDIRTGKNVQIIYPNIDLPIFTAFAKDGEKLSIHADLDKDQYRATGDMGIRGGEIFYFQRNFYIIDGNIDLNVSHKIIDPRISLTAKIKDFDRNGEKVDIFLSMDNNSLYDLSPTFSSIPSKPLAEISEILGGNIIPTNISRNNDFSTALAMATIATDVIQQVGLIQIGPMEELEVSIRNALNLDLFSIRTQVIQNILLDTIPGDFSSSFTRNPIARYLDNTTVFLGKYITKDMFVQAIMQLSINEGVNSGLFITDDIGFDIELSYEWDNPLYYLTLSMRPESFEFSDLLDSMYIGVSWSFTL